MAITSLRVGIDSSSLVLYITGALENPNILCLLGSRMFINLIEAGQSDVKNGSGTDVQSGRRSAISDIQFGDTSYHQSSKYILQDAKFISLSLTS